jgi:Tetracyclin repressor-like, C-terminal domain
MSMGGRPVISATAGDADPATALRAVLIWSRLHGIVSLEIDGNFGSMGIDPGQLFEAELGRL